MKISIMKIFYFLFVYMVLGIYSFAQPKILPPRNFGLTFPQDSTTLPRSRVPVVFPERTKESLNSVKFTVIDERTWCISSGWHMASDEELISSGKSVFDKKQDDGIWYNAVVPGTVLTTLIEAGVYPDPYWGLNNLAIPDSLCRQDWWYRLEFEMPHKCLGGKRVWIDFEGINYCADVWLNGNKLGEIRGAFARGHFDATGHLKAKGNVLAVRIHPPFNPGIPEEQSQMTGRGMNGGQLCMDGPTFICTEGWDWIPGIRDRNIGIWQPVKIHLTDEVEVGDVQVITDLPLPLTSYADVYVSAELVNHADVSRKYDICLDLEGKKLTHSVVFGPGERKTVQFSPHECPELRIEEPRLWWPNGYGEQNLYELELAAYTGMAVSDSKKVRFGIREFSYEMTSDTKDGECLRIEYNPLNDIRDGKPVFDFTKRRTVEKGVVVPSFSDYVCTDSLDIIEEGLSPYLVVKVNGKRIFCRGGNWGMDEGLKRVSREFLEPAFRLHKEAGFNIVRNWTGQSTESIFYELCDEYGMMVWNDFWMSTEGYNLNVNDETLFMENVREVVKRYRNHPSIVLWCPRNEGYAPVSLERKISEFIASADPTRHYHGNSRNMNLRPSGPWDYFDDPALYYTDIAKGFSTELGSPAIPTAESMRKMMAEEDLWPIGDVWSYHDLHSDRTLNYIKAIDSLYGVSETLDEFCKKAQMVNYDSYRSMFESWNSKMFRETSGLLLWMTHPAWPSVEWQVYSWDYETTGAYFGARKACAPIHAQINRHDNMIVALNASSEDEHIDSLRLICYSLDGKMIYKEMLKDFRIPSNSLKTCFRNNIEATSSYMARLELHSSGKVYTNDYLMDVNGSLNDMNKLTEGVVSMSILDQTIDENGMVHLKIHLLNTGDVPVYALKANIRKSSGESLLPAYFNDGYFNMLPGEERILGVEFGEYVPGLSVSLSGYNMPSRCVDINLQ